MTNITQSVKSAMAGAFTNKERSVFLAIVLSLILLVIDFPNIIGFDGIDVKNFSGGLNIAGRLIGSALIVFVSIFLIIYFLLKKESNKDFVWYIIIAAELAVFGVLGAFRNIGAIIHLILGWLIASCVLGTAESGEKKIKTLFFLYLIDFVIYPIVSNYVDPLKGIRFAFHPYLIFTLFNGATSAEFPILKGACIVSIIFFVLALFATFGANVYIINQIGMTDFTDVSAGMLIMGQGAKIGSEMMSKLFTGFGDLAQLFNTSRYVDNPGEPQQSENPQGVFLKEIERGEFTFKEGTPVYVWVKLEAKTLDKPIYITVRCKTTKENELGQDEEVAGIVDDDTQATKITVPVISGVERTISCKFNDLPYGSYDITYDATFDFSTDAIKKIYLMDRDRMMSDFELLHQKGLEPTNSNVLTSLYKIKDVDPITIYTNGPVSLGIGTDKSPWDIKMGSNNIKPLLGITVGNIWQTGSKIQNLEAIYLKIPNSLSLQTSTCTGIPINLIEPTTEEAEQGLSVYKLSLKLDEIEDKVTINCLMNINSLPLDNTAVTTRFLKAHVDYRYGLQQTISIEVERDDAARIE